MDNSNFDLTTRRVAQALNQRMTARRFLRLAGAVAAAVIVADISWATSSSAKNKAKSAKRASSAIAKNKAKRKIKDNSVNAEGQTVVCSYNDGPCGHHEYNCCPDSNQDCMVVSGEQVCCVNPTQPQNCTVAGMVCCDGSVCVASPENNGALCCGSQVPECVPDGNPKGNKVCCTGNFCVGTGKCGNCDAPVCIPESRDKTCAGQCGSKRNNCQQAVECDACKTCSKNCHENDMCDRGTARVCCNDKTCQFNKCAKNGDGWEWHDPRWQSRKQCRRQKRKHKKHGKGRSAENINLSKKTGGGSKHKSGGARQRKH